MLFWPKRVVLFKWKRRQTYVKVQISPQFVIFSIESLIENFDQFNHIPAKINSQPWSWPPFPLWSLVSDLCNSTLNWSTTSNFLQFSPWFSQCQPSYLRAFCSLGMFFINRALIGQWYTVKFQSLYFWTSSTNSWPFSEHFGILFSLLYFLIIFFVFLFFLRERKNVNWRITKKWVMTKKEDKVKYNPIYIIHGHTYWNIISKDSSNVSFLGSMEFIGIRRSLPNREFFFRPSFDC